MQMIKIHKSLFICSLIILTSCSHLSSSNQRVPSSFGKIYKAARPLVRHTKKIKLEDIFELTGKSHKDVFEKQFSKSSQRKIINIFKGSAEVTSKATAKTVYKLEKKELRALGHYMQDGSNENWLLRQGKGTLAAEEIKVALSKLPDYKGVVFRVGPDLNLLGKDTLATKEIKMALSKLPDYKEVVVRVIKNFKLLGKNPSKDDIISDLAFFSTSRELKLAKEKWKLNNYKKILFVIKSHHGKSIEKLKPDSLKYIANEAEVLFHQNTQFKVIEFDKDNSIMYLEEVRQSLLKTN